MQKTKVKIIVISLAALALFAIPFSPRLLNKADLGPEDKKTMSAISEPIDTFPVYPDSESSDSSEIVGERGLARSIILKTSDKLVDVVAFYKKALTNEDWQIENIVEQEEFVSFNFSKGNTKGFWGATRQGDETVITVNFGVE